MVKFSCALLCLQKHLTEEPSQGTMIWSGKANQKHVVVTVTSALGCELCECQQKARGTLCTHPKAFPLLPPVWPAQTLMSRDRCVRPAGQGKIEWLPCQRRLPCFGAGMLWWVRPGAFAAFWPSRGSHVLLVGCSGVSRCLCPSLSPEV